MIAAAKIEFTAEISNSISFQMVQNRNLICLFQIIPGPSIQKNLLNTLISFLCRF